MDITMNIHSVAITPSLVLPGRAFAECSAGDFMCGGIAEEVIRRATEHEAEHAEEMN